MYFVLKALMSQRNGIQTFVKLTLVAGCGYFILPQTGHADFSDELPPPAQGSPQKPAEENKAPPKGQSAPVASTPAAPVKQPAPSTVGTPAPVSGGKGAGSNPKAAAPKPAPGGQSQNPGGLLSDDIVQHDANAPLTYGADSMEASREKGKLVLTGNVVLTQADTTLWSDVAELTTAPNSSTFEKAHAKGHVKIQKKASAHAPAVHAEAKEIEYNPQNKIAILKGNPKIWKGEEVVQGEVMELNLLTSEYKVTRVRGVLDPKSQQTPEKKPGVKK
jgi:lipopolysaccharide transport protein LptA